MVSRLQFRELFSAEIDSPKIAKGVSESLEVQCKDHNIDFTSHNNINPRAHLNQDRCTLTEKGSI